MWPFRIRVSALFISILILTLSCSRSDSPVTPDISVPQSSLSSHFSENNRCLLSFNLVRIDPDLNTVDLIPLRGTETHFNVLKLLEIWPCNTCLTFPSISDSDHGTKLLDVAIQNPFTEKRFTVFDMRGIAMFYGSHYFPVIEKSVPDASLGDGELINANGYTSLYHYGTQLFDPTGYQCYIQGKFATVLAPLSWLQGYRRFATSDPANTRHALYANSKVTRTFDIDMPDTTFIFGYAVDASWVNPTVTPVNNPMVDFPPEANCPEPWSIITSQEPDGYGLTDEGGQTTLYIDVYDYQGLDSHSDPVIECTELFDGAKTATFLNYGIGGFNTWSIVVENEKLAPAGKYKCLIYVEDDANAGSPDWVDLTAYHVCTFDVISHPHGWARTWGSTGFESGYDVTVDSSGNVYVAGIYMDTVDFDPGAGTDNHSAIGYYDSFLCKYDTAGIFIWAKTWGGSGAYTYGMGIALDDDDIIYVTGYFDESVDFDPGLDVDIRTSLPVDTTDAYISKFDTFGNYQWVRTWGGVESDGCYSVIVDDSGYVYAVGSFGDTVDFDPGPGVDSHTTENRGSSLSKFNANGDFQWARTWGVGYSDYAHGVDMLSASEIYVAGSFTGIADFDPGPGEDIHTGSIDAYLVKYDSGGNYLWGRTWGGGGWDFAKDCAVDLDGSVWVTGSHEYPTDFDPGPGSATGEFFGQSDMYISKFAPSGVFLTVTTWGGPYQDEGYALACAGLAQVLVTGVMSTSDNYAANYYFAQKYTDTTQNWIRVYGGDEGLPNAGQGIASDSGGNAYVTANYTVQIDFNPDPVSEDIHTPFQGSDVFLTKLLPDGYW